MHRKTVLLVSVFILLTLSLLTGCANHPPISLGEIESASMLTGASIHTIREGAISEHKETGNWPDAIRLAQLGGLSIYNHVYGTSYAVYILDKPYHHIPATMDSTQTFAFYGHYCEDGSYYSYCRIYYAYRTGDFEVSSSEKGQAGLHGMILEAEQMLIDFYQGCQTAGCSSELDKVLHQHAMTISQTSPNPTAKQVLFEFAYDLLANYYQAVVNFAPGSPEFEAQFQAHSSQLGEFIHDQDWKHFG